MKRFQVRRPLHTLAFTLAVALFALVGLRTTQVAHAREVQADVALAAHWRFDERSGALVVDAIAGRNGLLQFTDAKVRPQWRKGGLFLPGGDTGSRVRVDAGQPIDGDTFEIALDVAPARDFEAGCLLASQPENGTLGGFRLCLSQANGLLRFDMSDGKRKREYATALTPPLPADRFSEIRVRGREGVLEVFVAGRLAKKFEVPRLRLAPSPYGFVMGAGIGPGESRFRGRLKNVRMSGRARSPRPTGATPLGFTTRGRWPLDEGEGTLVRDRVEVHHGIFESSPKRRPPEWRDGRLNFGGTADHGGVLVRNAGPLYGDDFLIEFDAWLEEPASDWGSMLVSKTGSSVRGGFVIDYFGRSDEIVVKMADGKRQVMSKIALPFDLPARRWVPISLRFVQGQLAVSVAQVQAGSADFPGFELAEAKDPLLVGAYYYPPSKGIRGSIRNVALHMRTESISASEGESDPAKAQDEGAVCQAKPMRDRLVVGNRVVVPNWLGATCLRKSQRNARFEFLIDLPEGFELLASGSSQVERGKVVKNVLKKLGRIERGGDRYRRYRVELSYRLTAGHTAGYGPLYIRATQKRTETAELPRMYFQQADLAGNQAPQSIALDSREFPRLPKPRRIHHSLAWMALSSSSTWPDFFDHYRALGFNTVPTLGLYDIVISVDRRRRFMKRARRKGFDLLVVDSTYHRMIFETDARTLTRDSVRQPYIDPAYRGVHYDAELDRMAERSAEIGADWLMMDIECFVEGAHACLIGTSERCDAYLAQHSEGEVRDRADAVTDLGVDLIANVRRRLADRLGADQVPRMGLNTSEPDETYHGLFDFNKLYDGTLDYAQPILYRQNPKLMGERIRSIRARMPRGDIIPWVDPGTVEEYPSEWVYDRVLEVFGSGGRGIAWFAFENFEGADLYFAAHAMATVIPVEDIIVGSEPLGEVVVEAGNVGATGIVNGDHTLLLVSDYERPDAKSRVTLRLPKAVRGTLWDLARMKPLGRMDGREISFDWQPGARGARTALYYLGSAAPVDGRFDVEAVTDPLAANQTLRSTPQPHGEFPL